MVIKQMPALEPLAKDGIWRVTRSGMYDFVMGWTLYSLTVAAGFETDGASIPRFFWRVIGEPFESRAMPAALAHDALYATEAMRRVDCDFVFRELLRRRGVGWCRRTAMWAAVRCFGWIVWRRHTRESRRAARRFVELASEPIQMCRAGEPR